MNKMHLDLKSMVLFSAMAFLIFGCKKEGKSILVEAQINEIESRLTNTSEKGSVNSDLTNGEEDLKKKSLLLSYPDFIKEISDNKVVFTDGTFIVYDDGREKDFMTMLDDSDVEDMFHIRYRLPDEAPGYLEDAGRTRSEALFKKMYGDSGDAVRRHLEKVAWAGQNILLTSVNGAADSLRGVAKELEKYPELKHFLKSSGTFYWRPVRGARRLSAHSYGIALDIAVDKANYWQWTAGTNDELTKIKYENRIPRKLVEIFQRHGFIWGGAWYHYDTMHFEFRPEILHYSAAMGLSDAVDL